MIHMSGHKHGTPPSPPYSFIMYFYTPLNRLDRWINSALNLKAKYLLAIDYETQRFPYHCELETRLSHK